MAIPWDYDRDDWWNNLLEAAARSMGFELEASADDPEPQDKGVFAFYLCPDCRCEPMCEDGWKAVITREQIMNNVCANLSRGGGARIATR